MYKTHAQTQAQQHIIYIHKPQQQHHQIHVKIIQITKQNTRSDKHITTEKQRNHVHTILISIHYINHNNI